MVCESVPGEVRSLSLLPESAGCGKDGAFVEMREGFSIKKPRSSGKKGENQLFFEQKRGVFEGLGLPMSTYREIVRC
ncbi:MAG: hypothetical protein P4M10_02735 [Verrucomicrobiae bacterium]|nr:hypothetical protein [Verrucomicrobiae bacterium]